MNSSQKINYFPCREFAKEALDTHQYPPDQMKVSPGSKLYKIVEESDGKYYLNTGHCIGADWLVPNQSALVVHPKMNESGCMVDYFTMLMAILNGTTDTRYLEKLIQINFDQPYIALDEQEDILSPFLIATFLKLVQQLVIKGLRHSYKEIEENLQGRIKGKILFPGHLKKNIWTGNCSRHYCRYQEFSVDIFENRVIKKALLFVNQILERKSHVLDMSCLKQIYDFILPAFTEVSDHVDDWEVTGVQTAALFPEYVEIIRYAQLLIRRFAFNVSGFGKESVLTPPFTIKTDLLFELFTYEKLKEVFSDPDAIAYQKKLELDNIYLSGQKEYKNQIPDFLVRKGDIKLIVDAKYKREYSDHTKDCDCIVLEDMRQLSGYSRLKGVHDFFNENESPKDYGSIFPCIIIYPVLGSGADNLECLTDKKDLQQYAIGGLVDFYKIGINLPFFSTK